MTIMNRLKLKSKQILQAAYRIQCAGDCHMWFHEKCVSGNKEELDEIRKKQVIWFCEGCDTSVSSGDESSSSSSSEEEDDTLPSKGKKKKKKNYVERYQQVRIIFPEIFYLSKNTAF
ncbi:hypothetical protein HHI36_018519 [Cryptolaemus montrouzieri]|uniref:PHD-type domain-containing protein n=1 Tax=Cryptolaemus montrouzieri TaxID=559131 RepID=A0ABD2P0M7_9CUCU